MSMHWAPEARHASVVVVVVVVVDVVVVRVVVVDVVVVDVVVVDVVVVGVVVVVVTSHTSLATSEQEWEPHENLKSPQVTSQFWEQSWPVHWSTHEALVSVK